jgi:DNA repair protein RadC
MYRQTSFVEQSDNRPRVRDLPEKERPVNRIREAGPRALSSAELIACLLQSGDGLHQAHSLLARFQDLNALSRASESDLVNVQGIGPAQAARLKAALELGKRLMAESPADRWQIRAPSDAAHLLLPQLSGESKENFVVLCLDTRNRVIHEETLYRGSLNTSLVRVCEVFEVAIKHNAAGVVLAHNHPSGDPSPSPEDVALTRRLVDAGKLLELEVLDHLVIGQNRFVSLRERGLGFESA